MDTTTLIFSQNSKKFVVLHEGNPLISRFMWDASFNALDEEDDLEEGLLEWNGVSMVYSIVNSDGTVNREEDVLAIELNKELDLVTVWAAMKYSGSCLKLISVEKPGSPPQRVIDLNNIFSYLAEIRYETPSASPHPLASTSQVSNVTQSSSNNGNVLAAKQLDSTGNKRKSTNSLNENQSKRVKATVNEISKRKLELQEMNMAADSLSRLSAELKTKGTPPPRRIRLEELVHDSTIRNINYKFVDELVEELKANRWHHELTLFTINKKQNDPKMYVLNGNHRLEAFNRFNEGTAAPITTVKCIVYENPSYEEQLLVTRSSNTEFKKLHLTELQMALLAMRIIKKRHLSIPKTDLVSVNSFNHLMKTVIGDDYLTIATGIIQVLPNVVNELATKKIHGQLMINTKFTFRFWRILFSAIKRNSTAALSVVSSSEFITPNAVEKRLKDVPQDFLVYLKSFGDHTFKDEKDAVKFITGNENMSNELVKKLLLESRVFHNSKRTTKKAKVDWSEVRKNVLKYISAKAQCKNLSYMGESVADFTPYSFILMYDPSPLMMERLRASCENCVVILLGALYEPAPVIPDTNPALSLYVLVQKPPVIDCDSEKLPCVALNATLYVPETPDSTEDVKMKFLLSMAADRRCKLASALVFKDLAIYGEYGKEYSNVLVSNACFPGLQSLLKKLNYFQNIHVIGDKKCRKEVEELLLSDKKTLSSEESMHEDSNESINEEE